MNTLTINEQVRLLGAICREHNVNLHDLRKAFPNKPTTREECGKIAVWLAKYIAAAKATTGALEAQVSSYDKGLRGTEQTVSINPPRPSAPQKPQVADGHFAIPAGELGYDKPHFFRVKAGRKAGVVFLDEQASDDRFPVRDYARKTAILGYLAANEQKARELYGVLISRCSRCNRTLTDHNNPFFPAYGPECGGK